MTHYNIVSNLLHQKIWMNYVLIIPCERNLGVSPLLHAMGMVNMLDILISTRLLSQEQEINSSKKNAFDLQEVR